MPSKLFWITLTVAALMNVEGIIGDMAIIYFGFLCIYIIWKALQ